MQLEEATTPRGIAATDKTVAVRHSSDLSNPDAEAALARALRFASAQVLMLQRIAHGKAH
jgi:hypothetical protein